MQTNLSRRVAITGLCAAVAVPVTGQASAADPIFMLIEKHQAARAALDAAGDAVEAIAVRRPASREPRVQLGVLEEMTITIGKEVKHSPGGKPFYARSRDGIGKHFPADHQRARREELLAEWDWQEAEAVVPPEVIEADLSLDEAVDAENDATVAMLTTPPTTLAGAVALLRYMAETDTDGDAYHNVDCGDVGDSLSALIASLIVTLAPLAVQS